MNRRVFAVLLALAVLSPLSYGLAPAQAQVVERVGLRGRYVVECRDASGRLRWRETVHNVVTTVGINLMLDTSFLGSGYTATGPFAGLISGASFSGVSASDTMASHPGWIESGLANPPTYLTGRRTVTFSSAAAGQIATSAPFSFSITGTGVVGGVFIVYGSGASATIDDTGGTLYSASVFDTTHTVSPFDTININYATGM